MPEVRVRPATEADFAAIAAVTVATGQHEDWAGSNPAYLRHLLGCGTILVGELGGTVAGFGATCLIGAGDQAVTMLCDLFVDPAAQGSGCGRAILTQLWTPGRPKMTFSSLHANALPLYTSFGLDAWWPLLYLHGDPARLPVSGEWTVRPVAAGPVAGYELDWTVADRRADHEAWASRPGGQSVLVSRDAEVIGAGTVINCGRERGIVHLAVSPAADDTAATAVVLQTLAQLPGQPGTAAAVCLPAPHPAVRALLAAGWRFDEFDLYMATDPGLLDPRRAVPSPGQA
jgi:GNAT superfamily N-acetyltransferase